MTWKAMLKARVGSKPSVNTTTIPWESSSIGLSNRDNLARNGTPSGVVWAIVRGAGLIITQRFPNRLRVVSWWNINFWALLVYLK